MVKNTTTCFPGYAVHLVGWVGWGGVGEVITFVGTFTHLPCYMFSRVRRASGGVGWVGWVGRGGGRGGDNVRWNIHTSSMLHVFQGTQGIWWGGLGGVGCNNMTF